MPQFDSVAINRIFDYTPPSFRFLEANIKLSHTKPNTVAFQPEGTNTAGDLGAAAVLTYQNRNLFHGSELFSIELRAAFEAIKGLEGYSNHNYEEYGVQAKLQFPRFLSPFSIARVSPSQQCRVRTVGWLGLSGPTRVSP